MSELTVRDQPDLQRFEAVLGEEVLGFVEYQRTADLVVITHTEVPPEIEGRGVGSKLIQAALDSARDRGLKVVPQCPFVRAYMDKHPEMRDMLG